MRSTTSASNPALGAVYTATAWVRADTSNGRLVFAALRERGGSAADRTVYGRGVALSTQWQQITVTATVGSAGRSDLDFYVVEDPGDAGHVFYADDLTFAPAPSGQAVPVGNLSGWRQVFTEDFTKDAATGSWGSSCATDPDPGAKIVYTGATGSRWRTYPDCYPDTEPRHPYRSDQVLSVHDGVLDFYLHNVNGVPAGANPSPVINDAAGSQYQTYGRYTVRFRIDNRTLSEYKVAWLLWPQDEPKWPCAESDWPESSLTATTAWAFNHNDPACSDYKKQDSRSSAVDYTQWHTYTQEWAPGVRRYYLDGQLLGQPSTTNVYAAPERWQLQTETTGNGAHSGHLLVDWVAVYAYQP